jgi:single-strand DNA-binding protein
MNVIFLIGNVGSDPDIRTTQGGTQVANFSLATSERWKDKDGEKQEKTTWHRITVWGPLSKVVEGWVTKGSKLAIQGRLESRKWTDRDGNEKLAWEVNTTNLELLGEKGARKPARNGDDEEEQEEAPRPRRRSTPAAKPKPKEKYSSDMDLDDDIPF